MLWKGFQRPKRLEVESETLSSTFGRFHAQPFEAQRQVLADPRAISGRALGGDHQSLSLPDNRLANARFTGAVGVGGVQKSHVQVQAVPHHGHGLVIRQSLDRNAPKANSRDHQLRSS